VTDLPRITALMPVRNGMKFLGQSRATLDASLSPGDELIVVNDNSNDGTLDFLNEWQAENSQVRVIHNKKNGLISSLQLGVDESDNNWIARYDVDDQYETNRLEVQRKAISSETGAIFSDYTFISDEKLELGTLPSPVESHATSISLINGNRTPHPSVLFSKTAYLESGGYRDSDFLVEDLSLWLRMSRVSKLISVPEVLLKYRMHAQSVTLANQQEMKLKKYSLLQDVGVNDSDIEYSIENLNTIFDSYRFTGYRAKRQACFIYDVLSLIKSKQVTSRIAPKNYAQLTKALLRPDIVIAVSDLRKEQKRRDLFRNLQSHD